MNSKYSLLKKLVLFTALFLGFTLVVNAQNAWINEFHYDNAGTDVNEMIEVVVENPGSYNLSNILVHLYNGSNGQIYGTKNLGQYTAGATVGNFTIYYRMYPQDSIQNGSPDGIALSYNSTLISGQFLSYEGQFLGVGGPANGVTSSNIGVSETGTTPVGSSLQLSGTGVQYAAFTWQSPATATPGALNNGQTFSAAGVSNPTNFDATPVSTTQNDLSWLLNSNSDSVLIAHNTVNTFGTPSGVYAVSGSISGGGTVLYKGTADSTGHTSLTPNTKYYYKAWSYSNAHVYSSGVTDSATTYKIEPTNYPTAFTATATGITANLTWTDATGAQLPDKYLVKISNQDNITAPSDGTPVADDRDVSDGSGAISVSYGTQTFTFFRLEETTVYYFKIYPYTNTGAGINYKTDGTAPSASDTTQAILNTNDFESNTFGTWTTYNLASSKNWSVYTGTGAYATTHYANINGYQGSSIPDTIENDWLISPSLNLVPYTNEKMIFFSWWNFGTDFNELKLKYSTDYVSGDPTSATWTELTFTKPTSAQVWVPSGFIDLSAINSSNVHLAFHYLSTSNPRSWSIDEIEITGNGVSNPTNFNAVSVSSTQVDLSWIKNMNNNNVIIARNTSNTFGTPVPGNSYPAGGLLFGGGTVIYNGSGQSFNDTGRTPATTYYYKIWSYNASYVYSSGVTDNTTTQFAEPANHPTGLTAISNSYSEITVSWTDSDAAHYLIKGSSVDSNAIVAPVDGVGENDGLLVKNVNAGVQTKTFTGLWPNTTYFFKIYPYNGTAEAANYKTSGTIPTKYATTGPLDLKLIISEVVDPLDAGNAKYVELTNTGTTTINFSTTPVYICRQNNATTWASLALTGTLAAGENHIVGYLQSVFDTAYDITADQYGSLININGNDGVYLYYAGNNQTGLLFDAFGQINVDGDTTGWKYTDGHAVRKRTVTSPNATWTENEWVIVRNLSYTNMTPNMHGATATWQGTLSTDWNTKGTNWGGTGGWVPDASCIVTIPNVTNYPIVTKPSACHQLIIQSSAAISIQSTGSLRVVGP